MTLASDILTLLGHTSYTLRHLTSLLPAEHCTAALCQLVATAEAAAKLAEVAHLEALTAQGGAMRDRGPEVYMAEAEKVKHETERLKVEVEKVGKEAERAVAETERLKAEAMMVRSEKMRIDAETERLKAAVGVVGGTDQEGAVKKKRGEGLEVESVSERSEGMMIGPETERLKTERKRKKAQEEAKRENNGTLARESNTVFFTSLSQQMMDEAIEPLKMQAQNAINESRAKGRGMSPPVVAAEGVQARTWTEIQAKRKADMERERVEAETASEQLEKSAQWQEWHWPKNESRKTSGRGMPVRRGNQYVPPMMRTEVLVKPTAEIERERMEAERRELGQGW